MLDLVPAMSHRKKMRSLKNQAAIPFTLKDTQGREHTLHDSKGRWLLLLFHRHLG